MEHLQSREKEIFETLNELKKFEFVVIGGYAVNTYTLPRFSIDCDIVVKNKSELNLIENKLKERQYKKEVDSTDHFSYQGTFIRYVKKIDTSCNVSMDILIDKIVDRQTETIFSVNWVFEHSSIRNLIGKTISETLKLRIINPDALVVMKAISCRNTDIRDVFMILPIIKDLIWVKKEINKYYSFNNRFKKIKEKVTSSFFKNNLQGVYGYIDQKIFDRHVKILLKMNAIKEKIK